MPYRWTAVSSFPSLFMACLAVSGCGLLGAKEEAPVQTIAVPVTRIDSASERPTLAPAIDRADLLGIVDVADPTVALPSSLAGGKNEWVSFVLRVQVPPKGQPATLVLPKWQRDGKSLDVRQARVFQVLPLPANVNRAGYVRQTGRDVTAQSLPRALLPVQASNGRVDLTVLRSPAKPTDAAAVAVDEPVLLWCEWRIPTGGDAGRYDAAVTYETPAAEAKSAPAVRARLPVSLDVADFVLPDDRHLTMVADLPWERLRRLWPDAFEVVQPHLLSRGDSNSKPAVDVLDQLMTLAEENRVQVHVPALQPVAKWKPGLPVQIDWGDYDKLIEPWLTGSLFADKVPLGFWAIPRVNYLDNRPAANQLQYYAAAASHFDGRDWLRFSPVILTKDKPGLPTLDDKLRLSADAARVLASQPRVRVMLPLEPGDAQLANTANPNLIDPAATGRLNCVAPGLISNSEAQTWPANLDRPQPWMTTDLSGLIPYVGAGSQEQDVRVWAFAAFLRADPRQPARNLVQWDACLPRENDPATPAEASELTWFYPGSWFGIDGPVPSVQLKWLRRAQQDFEYLRLAQERGSLRNVLPMARVLAKPVVIQPGQAPDPVYSLLLGTADENAWRNTKPILTQIIQNRGLGVTPDENAISGTQQQTLDWITPLEEPVILPRRTDWSVSTPPPGESGQWLRLRLGFDLYNASDTTPVQNELSLSRPNAGWQSDPPSVTIPKLETYQVARQALTVRIDVGKANVTRQPPVRVDYKSGFSGTVTPLDVAVPVRYTSRRRAPLLVNGSIDEWSDEDALQNGPMLRMESRPSVQTHTVQFAATPSKLYSAWGNDDLYLAFRVEGVSQTGPVQAGRNFVTYENNRAWGEDVCQCVMQAVYDNGATGPLVHVSVKPGGNSWVEKRDTPRDPWQQLGNNLRYAATVDAGVWRGEVAIPWDALINAGETPSFNAAGKPNLPTLVKFNFVQHKRDGGESATWAGPVDEARDADFTGVLVLRDNE